MATPIHPDSPLQHGGLQQIAGEVQPGLLGESVNAPGVMGKSNRGHGVYALSVSGSGLHARSTEGRGVEGWSAKAYGVSGDSTKSAGVRGTSVDGTGVEGWSTHGVGVFGTSTRGRAGLFEGNVEVRGDIDVSGDVRLANPGADCAEDFDVAAGSLAEPGSVMVLGEGGALTESSAAYDKRVVGVVSGAGGWRPAIVLDRQSTRGGRVPVGLVGKVYCKVDARYGVIDAGDLLTTSPTPGHAMKADDPSRAFGAILGKALGAQRDGSGLIPILIALQ